MCRLNVHVQVIYFYLFTKYKTNIHYCYIITLQQLQLSLSSPFISLNNVVHSTLMENIRNDCAHTSILRMKSCYCKERNCFLLFISPHDKTFQITCILVSDEKIVMQLNHTLTVIKLLCCFMVLELHNDGKKRHYKNLIRYTHGSYATCAGCLAANTRRHSHI